MSQTIASLDAMLARFGIKETIEMLEFSHAYINQWEQQLCTAMLAGDWENAKLHAHKAISSVRIYGSPRLEALLYQIRDSDDSINAEVMQQTLTAEFSYVRHIVSEWILEHQPQPG